MLKSHRIAEEHAERARYAQAARTLRHEVALRRYQDPTVRELHLLLNATATVLEAAGFKLPADVMLRSAVAAVADEVQRLRVAGEGSSSAAGMPTQDQA